MGERSETIASVISEEFDRQARAGAIRIDVEALAGAIDDALDGHRVPGEVQMRNARRPDQLNATNDG